MQRALKIEEKALLRSMLEASGRNDLICELESALVSDMKDGGMGSLRFGSGTKMGSVLCEAQSADIDNIPLEISINLDDGGNLFELDIWKVNFAPLQAYPTPSSLRFLDPKP